MLKPNALFKSVLIVEDNAIIALDLESCFEDMGFEQCRVAKSVDTALFILDNESIELVILDVDLGSETSEPIAERLAKAKMPFIFSTGMNERGGYTGKFAHVPVVMKPFKGEALQQALRSLSGN